MPDNRTAMLVELCRVLYGFNLDTDNAWNNNGAVCQPGKFQGEPIETLYFWDQYLQGSGEAIGDWTVFPVDPTEQQVFALDKATRYFAVRETSDGFVIRAEMTEAEYTQICDEADAAGDEFAENNATD